MGAASQQRTLTPPDTWSCPILDLHLFLCWDHSFLNLSCTTDLLSFEHPSVLLFCFASYLDLLLSNDCQTFTLKLTIYEMISIFISQTFRSWVVIVNRRLPIVFKWGVWLMCFYSCINACLSDVGLPSLWSSNISRFYQVECTFSNNSTC